MLISQSSSSEARAKMSPSLSSFLQTYPYKRKDCLEHVCETLKMSKNGTCDTLTARIIAYVDDNMETDIKVRDIAQQFKINKNKTHDNSRHTSTPSQPVSQLLFSDTQSQPTPIRDITKEIDELEDMANELTLNGNTDGDKSESSFNDDNAQGPTIQQKTLSSPDDADSELSEISFKKQMKFLIAESVKIIASKDHQIETLEKNLAKVIEYSGNIIEKHDADLKKMIEVIEKHDAELKKVTEEKQETQNMMAELITEVKAERAERSRLESKLVEKNEQLVTTITQLNDAKATMVHPVPAASSVAQNVHDRLQKIATSSYNKPNETLQKGPTSTAPSPTTTTPPFPCETPTENPGDQNKNQTDEVIIVVADSNGKHLKPNLLHDKKKVIIETRFTWEDAHGTLPKTDYPEKVKDIVMLIGLNNIKNAHEQIPDVVKKADVTCRKYQESFPNATIHLGSIAPVDSKCMAYNLNLQELATERGAPFISTEGMFDRSGNVKPDILHGIHYTRRGVSTIAKAIKRSLYNCPPRRVMPASLPAIPKRAPAEFTNQTSSASPVPNHALILETFCNIAKACLQQH